MKQITLGYHTVLYHCAHTLRTHTSQYDITALTWLCCLGIYGMCKGGNGDPNNLIVFGNSIVEHIDDLIIIPKL